MDRSHPNADCFTEALKRLFEKTGGGLLKSMRQKAFDHFLELGLPEKKQSDFQYIPLRLLYEERYRFETVEASVLPLPEASRSFIVFAGGQFRPELSDLSALPKGVVVLPILEAMRSYGTFLQNRWSRALKEETDPFAILNLACHSRGVFIYVPPKVVCKTPIQCIHVNQGGHAAMPRLQIFLASEAELSCVETYYGDGWTNSLIDIAQEDSSHFSHTVWNASQQGWNTSAMRATIKRDCHLSHFSMLGGGFCKRQSFKIALMGENADASLQGGWILARKNQAHAHVVMEHIAPSCRSMQKFKGIVSDTAQSSFQGKIFVRKEAQKTEAYQLSNNLIVSPYAIANCKPGLEIFADDVKASHGATVSQLNADQLFYLQSRGIREADAKKLLINGFCKEIFDKIPYESLRREIVKYVAQTI